MDIEVIKLIRRYKPHLLPIYLGAPARTTDGERRKRNTSPPRDDDPPASKRVRHGFSPTAEQRRAHTVLTAEEHQGKSGDAFVEYVVSSPTIQFVLHPGVLARIYDLQFGSRGLSLMHFRRVGFIDKLRMQAQASFNPSDYTLLPPRPTPAASWSDLGSAARSFLDYCRSVCDPDTVSVAEALERFVSALEGWKQFGDADIPLLVLWIDATLEKYRNSSVYDSFNDSTTRKAAADWFSTTNPELHSLLLTSIREQLSVGQLSIANAGHAGHGRPAPRLGVERKIPVDVISSIPTKDGKEVCLQFLSVRGCNPENPDECKYKNRVHFRPATLPPKLLQYIKNKLGGVAKIYSQA
ncbi:hypothetical protein BBJ28_00024184 [Nothophytophthora sp. Chile5]|nr:hypothetical protein BBJ28_00024184 [Nothophytophthora sp. Chile5]